MTMLICVVAFVVGIFLGQYMAYSEPSCPHCGHKWDSTRCSDVVADDDDLMN